MFMEKKNVLIIGSSAKDFALAKKFTEYGCEVFVAPGNSRIAEIAQCVDIREENIQELLEFVLENAIDLTIVTSELAIKQNIAGVFQSNNQMIFAPSAQSAEMTLSRSSCKRGLYKLRIPSPRFSIYDKMSLAVDYLKNANMPQVIRTDKASKNIDRLVCTTFLTSKTFVEDLFCRGEEKLVFEDYVYGHEFTLYVVTDGYQAVPLATVANYKFMENGDGGILTSGIGCYVPDYKVSKTVETALMQQVVENILQGLQRKETPYLGILGLDCVLKDDGTFVVLDLKPFLADHDAQAVLDLVEENLYTLFEACAIGSFADDYDIIKTSENSSVSCVISSRIKGKVIEGLDVVDSEITPFDLPKNQYLEYETIEGKNLVLTKKAKTLSRARQSLYEDAEAITFEGKKYRTDICAKVEKF
jgi:phosphoribosylamine--glycine ligase